MGKNPASIEQEANLGLLDGKSAIITGSARGIGRATAELFCREGANVLINDLDGDVAEQAAKEIEGETAVFAGDLTKPGTPEEMVKAAIDSFGQVDAVVNNAGYTWDGVVHKMTDEQFQAMLDFRKIVNVTSISGTMGNAGQANYSSAKAGVTGLTKTIAKEWGSFKINCNAVAFGFVETRLTQAKEKGETMEAAGESGEQVALGIPEQLRQMARVTIPLGRPAEPEEAAGPVLFLCSPLSNFIHGQVINATGGQFTGMYS